MLKSHSHTLNRKSIKRCATGLSVTERKLWSEVKGWWMEGAEMGPRCTAVWQVRTNADRMICDDGKQMTEHWKERNDKLKERRRERSDHCWHCCQCRAYSYVRFGVISRGHWGQWQQRTACRWNKLRPCRILFFAPNRKSSPQETAKSKFQAFKYNPVSSTATLNRKKPCFY